jgi:hypothetical protein
LLPPLLLIWLVSINISESIYFASNGENFSKYINEESAYYLRGFHLHPVNLTLNFDEESVGMKAFMITVSIVQQYHTLASSGTLILVSAFAVAAHEISNNVLTRIETERNKHIEVKS